MRVVDDYWQQVAVWTSLPPLLLLMVCVDSNWFGAECGGAGLGSQDCAHP